MVGLIRIKYFTMRGDGILGLQFYGVGGRIGDGSCEHDSNIFIGDIFGDLLTICIISSLQIRILPQELIQLSFIVVFFCFLASDGAVNTIW